MKKVFAVLLLVLSAGCFAYMNLLSEEDWLYLEKDNEHPAITLSDSGEEYYNEWNCHLGEELELEIVPVTYEGKRMGSPTISVEINNRTIEYALDPEPLKFSKIIIDKWKLLIDRAHEACFVSSFLQNTPDGELRIIQRIKSHKGIWDWYDESKNYQDLQRSNFYQ